METISDILEVKSIFFWKIFPLIGREGGDKGWNIHTPLSKLILNLIPKDKKGRSTTFGIGHKRIRPKTGKKGKKMD